MTFVVNDDITKSTPEKSLLSPKRRSNGRNVYGRITVRHRGGGHKRMLRDIDFRREKLGIPASARASFHCYTVPEEIDALVRGLHRALKVFAR